MCTGDSAHGEMTNHTRGHHLQGGEDSLQEAVTVVAQGGHHVAHRMTWFLKDLTEAKVDSFEIFMLIGFCFYKWLSSYL